MNPIPASWFAIGGGVLLALGAWGGWTVRDWKRDAEVLAELKNAADLVNKQRDAINRAAEAYEKERQDAQVQTNVRESTIREIYRDRPVPTDCAAGDDVRSVLDDAVRASNARASGQPATGVPGATVSSSTADRP